MEIRNKRRGTRDPFEEAAERLSIDPKELEQAYEKTMKAIRGFMSEAKDLEQAAQHSGLCMLIEEVARRNGSDAVEDAELIVEAIKNKRRVFGKE